jgi:hypothetical protein
MVRLRAYSANSCRYAWHFFNRSPNTELLKAAQLRYLEVCIRNFPIVIEENVNLSVTLKSSYGIYLDVLHSFSTLRRIE